MITLGCPSANTLQDMENVPITNTVSTTILMKLPMSAWCEYIYICDIRVPCLSSLIYISILSLYKCRYFVVKSNNLKNLHLSIKWGMWATQPKNESILNEAFHLCDNIILIVSINQPHHWEREKVVFYWERELEREGEWVRGQKE